MSAQLPDYYFRVRDNGAFVFRIDTENRQRRIEMDQIAVINQLKQIIKCLQLDPVQFDDSVCIPASVTVSIDTERRATTRKADVDEIRQCFSGCAFEQTSQIENISLRAGFEVDQPVKIAARAIVFNQKVIWTA